MIVPGSFNGPAVLESLIRNPEFFPYVHEINSVKAEDPYVMWDSIPRHDPNLVQYAEDYLSSDKKADESGPLFQIVEIKGDHYHIERDPITMKETIMDVTNMVSIHDGIRSFVSPKYNATVH